MEPFSLAVLAIAFLKAAVSSAGAEVGKAAGQRIAEALFPAVAGTPHEPELSAVAQGVAPPGVEQTLQHQVADRAANDPAFAQNLATTLDRTFHDAPGLADLLPRAAQQLFGLSDEQTAAQKGRCPVGGEWLLFPSYFDAQGRRLSTPATFFGLPRSAWAQCRKGHRWPVFAVGGS